MRDPTFVAGQTLERSRTWAASPMPSSRSGVATRLMSLDLLRGLDVLLMLFVNEIAGVPGTPAFLRHVSATADGMTITDAVFPAFLFITGMAIPLALAGRLRRNEPHWRVWRHVVARTIALLVIGVFMVNADEASSAGILQPALWNVLMTVGVVLVWYRSERDQGDQRDQRGQRDGREGRSVVGWMLCVAGVALLVLLAFVYRADDGAGAFQLRPRWWGILGLIGWAYFVASAIYLLARSKRNQEKQGSNLFVLVGATALLYCLYLADAAGNVSWLAAVRPYLSVGSVLGSHAAIVLSGTVLTVLLTRHRDADRPLSGFVLPALAYAAALAAAGVLLHSLHALNPAFTINKIRATAPWCLLCSAYTAAAWTAVFALADVKGWRRWPEVVTIAGENALVAYLLAPFLASLFAMSAMFFRGVNPYEALGHSNTVIGFIRSALFAWIVVRLCGWIRARGVRIQL
jgi:heparan-alpha-glucosaminide N-acetyltransferase